MSSGNEMITMNGCTKCKCLTCECSGKGFPPRIVATKNTMKRIRKPDCWRVITYLKSYVQKLQPLDTFTEFLPLEEHAALMQEKDAEIARLTAFIVKVKNSSTCPATVLVAGQVLEGHDVRQALSGDAGEKNGI